MRASLVRTAEEKNLTAHGCGAKSTKGSWQSRSVCHGHADSMKAQSALTGAKRTWICAGLSLIAVSVMQTFPRTDPLPGGSTDTRGATPPRPIPAVVSTARSAGASSDAAAGSDTLCGERTKRPIS